MQIRLFPAAAGSIGERLQSLIALPGFPGEQAAHGPINLACTDNPAVAAELKRDLAGKVPVWLDLDAAPPFAYSRHRLRAGIAAADLVTVGTRGLWEEVREHNYRVALVPDPVALPEPTTAERPPLVGPAVGLFDRENHVVDHQILIDLARQNRDLEMHLDGEIVKHPLLKSAERQLPNLHFAHDAGESLWRGLLAAVLPYRNDRQTLYWIPRPLLECWAVGLPAVVTPLPEVGRLEPLALFAATATGFAARIKQLLAEPEAAADLGKRAADFIAREHSLQAVARRLQSALTELHT